MRQLDALVAHVRAALGEATLGGYLHGSTATGRRQPTSDTDLLVVTARRMTDDERRDLVRGILPLSGRGAANGPARPVELTVVVRDDVVPWRFPPTEDFLYGEWERAGYEAGDPPRRRTNPDLATLLAMVLTDQAPEPGLRSSLAGGLGWRRLSAMTDDRANRGRLRCGARDDIRGEPRPAAR